MRVDAAAADDVAAGRREVALPKRASSGPASRNDARMRLQSCWSGSVFVDIAAWTRTSFAPIQSTSAPRSASSSIIVSTSRIRGTLCEHDSLLREQAGGEDRQRAVLVPGGADAAVERARALDDESVDSEDDGHEAAILAGGRTRPATRPGRR